MTTGLFYEHDTTSLRSDLEAATAHLDASTRTRLAMILDRIERMPEEIEESVMEELEDAVKDRTTNLEGERDDAIEEREAAIAERDIAQKNARRCTGELWPQRFQCVDASTLTEDQKKQVRKLAADLRKYRACGDEIIIIDPVGGKIQTVSWGAILTSEHGYDRLAEGRYRIVRGYKC